MDIRTQLASNTLSNGLKLVITVGIGLLIPPFMVVQLGVGIYGVWALLVAMSSLVYVFDLGLQPALMKYVADAHTTADTARLSRDVNTVLAIYLGSGIIAVLAGWLVSPILVSSYFKEYSSIPYLKTLVVAFMALSVLGMIIDVFLSALSGAQRMDQANIISMWAMIVQAAVLVTLLLIGWGLWGIAASMTVGHCFRALLTRKQMRRLLPHLRVRLFYRPRWSDVRRLAHLSTSGIAIRIGGTITGQLNKFLIGCFAGMSWVAYYDLAARVVGQFGAMASIMFMPLIPSVSQLTAQRDQERTIRLTEQSLVYMNLLALPFFWFLLIFAKSLITAWLGPGFEVVALTLQVLIVAHYINLLSGPAFHTSLGMGKPALGIWAAMINSSLFCIAAVAGGFLLGYWGIIAGEFVGVTAGGLFLIVMFRRTEGIPILAGLWRSVATPSFLTLACTACLALVNWKLDLNVLDQSLWLWGIEFFLYWLACIGLFRLAGVWGDYEWSLVQSMFRRSTPAVTP